MRHKKLVSVAVATGIAAIALPSFGQTPIYQTPVYQTPPTRPPVIQSGFRCDTSGEIPTTIYQSSQGKPEPWIKWVSDYFSGSGWSPNDRCQEVSSRLETYRRNKQLKYVTLGTINNQSVICVASQNQGPCEGIVYTLKPEQDGLKTLNNLFAWRKGGEVLESNYESVTSIPYINVGSRLDETTTTPPVVEPNIPDNREL